MLMIAVLASAADLNGGCAERSPPWRVAMAEAEYINPISQEKRVCVLVTHGSVVESLEEVETLEDAKKMLESRDGRPAPYSTSPAPQYTWIEIAHAKPSAH